MDTTVKGAPRRRRRHSAEFKARVIEACRVPGVSVAGVALANGLNANYLRRWLKEDQQKRAEGSLTPTTSKSALATTTLVAAAIQAPGGHEAGEIRIDIRRGQTTVQIACPVSCAAAFGEWLKAVLP